jgi:hypothetical protein
MFDCKQILQLRFAGQYKNHLAPIGGSILPVFRADAEGKRVYGLKNTQAMCFKMFSISMAGNINIKFNFSGARAYFGGVGADLNSK